MSNMRAILDSVVEKIETCYAGKTDYCGIETGFSDLDSMTSGMQLGELIIVAGRPSMGKTAFSINIAEHVALELNKPVAIFSMEMGGTQLAMRMIGSVGMLNQHTLRIGKMEVDDWSRMTHALGRLADAPINIIDTLEVGWSAENLEKILLESEDRPSLVVIDGLQSFDVTKAVTAYDRNIQLGEQVRQLKKMALKMNVPVILTASLNRELESRPNKRPVLRDLKDIGMLEDIADLILFIHRDAIYNSDSFDKCMAEIIIGKQRNGPVGMVPLRFMEESMRFYQLTKLGD